MRAAVYARYSSDMQRDASIEDQIRLCRQRIGAEGWTYLDVYADRASSGSSTVRPAYQRLLGDARSGLFDVVLAEALDRLSRDQEDIAGLFKRLRFAGIRLFTVAEGEITELHVGLKGTMNALFLKDLAQKVRLRCRPRARCSWRADLRRSQDQHVRSRHRAPNLCRILRRQVPSGDRGRAQCRTGPWPAAQELGTIYDLRQLAPRHRRRQQRALHRQAGVEPSALCQGPRDRQAPGAGESVRRMGHPRGSGTAHRRRSALGCGEGSAASY